MKSRGGLYIWRVRKPHAILGLPILGRHFGYAGMTNSYYHREGQHLRGSVTYGRTPAPWSDLEPRCYRIPLPRVILHGHYRRKITFALETLLIYATCPVYNSTQQPPWNLRKIGKAKAAAMRFERDKLGKASQVARFALRWLLYAAVVGAAWFAHSKGWIG